MITSIREPDRLLHQQGRWLFLQLLGLVAFCLLGTRLIDLHICKQAFLQGEGNSRALRTIGVPSYRGMITDRLGVPLAVSTPRVYAVEERLPEDVVPKLYVKIAHGEYLQMRLEPAGPG